MDQAIKRSEAWCEDSPVDLGGENRDASTCGGELVSVGPWDLDDEAFPFEAAEIVRRLPRRVGSVE